MNLIIVAIISISIIVNTLSSYAFAEENFALNVQIKSSNQEEVYVSRVTASEIKASPAWILEEESPPLGSKLAVDNARIYLNAKFPDYVNAEVIDIYLDDFIYYNELRDKWYYIIVFAKLPLVPSKPEPFSFNGNENFSVLVMMDGRVPEITSEKRGHQRQKNGYSERVPPSPPTPSSNNARSAPSSRPSKPIEQ